MSGAFLISSSITRATASPGSPPTPVPKRGKATVFKPSSTAFSRALFVALRTVSRLAGSSPRTAAWIT